MLHHSQFFWPTPPVTPGIPLSRYPRFTVPLYPVYPATPLKLPLPSYPVFYDTPIVPLPRYPVPYPTPLPPYPATPEDSRCEFS